MLRVQRDEIEDLKKRADEVAGIISLAANSKRLLILCFLTEGEAPVGKIQEALGIGQSSLSQHLSKLREGGVVATRRDAQIIYYRLADEQIIAMMQAMCNIFASKG